MAIVWTAAALTACDDSGDGAPAVDARSLVRAGLGAAGADYARVRVVATRRGPVLRLRVSELPRAGGLPATLDAFTGVRARIVRFCPPPGALRCKPALRATGTLAEGRSVGPVVRALRHAATRAYDARVLVRRRRAGSWIVTPHGELLGAVVARGRTVRMSFGGPAPGPRWVRVPQGRLVLEAGPEVIAVTRASLPAIARRVLEDAHRLVVAAPLTSE
jgi:hypothetical protein